MTKLSIFLLSVLAFATPNAYGHSVSLGLLSWDGTTLGVSLFPKPDCGRWSMWYFKRNAPQTPGTQCGSDTGEHHLTTDAYPTK